MIPTLMLNLKTIKSLYGFSRSGVISPSAYRKLLVYFGEVEKAWQAPLRELKSAGLTERMLEEVATVRELDLEAELSYLQRQGVTLLTPAQEAFPESLRKIPDCPYLLYVLGELLPTDEQALAVVGSRKQTRYGLAVMHKLIPALVAEGITIVSGLALGNDSSAHQLALKNNGRTIAVLGSGILKLYPQSSRALAKEIVTRKQGVIISEFPPTSEPFPYNFPIRNRLISGLSRGVLVVEAGERSGTLITASHALEQGREVLAVPGDITSPLSKGPHRLLSMGAVVVTEVADIINALGLPKRSDLFEPLLVPESAEEEVVLTILKGGESHIDEVIRASGLATSVVSATLSLMQLKGMVVDCGGGCYRLR